MISKQKKIIKKIDKMLDRDLHIWYVFIKRDIEEVVKEGKDRVDKSCQLIASELLVNTKFDISKFIKKIDGVYNYYIDLYYETIYEKLEINNDILRKNMHKRVLNAEDPTSINLTDIEKEIDKYFQNTYTNELQRVPIVFKDILDSCINTIIKIY